MTRWSPSSLILMLAAVIALGPPTAGAEISPEERVLVTETRLIQQMGLAPEGEIYLWTKGAFDRDPAYYLMSRGIPVEESLSSSLATGQVNHYAVDGRQFQERSSGFDRAQGAGGTSLVCTSASTDPFADAQLQLPNGADLDLIRIWGVDNCSGETIGFLLFEQCQPDSAAGDITVTTLGSASSHDLSGNFSVVIDPASAVSIDNLSCTYQVRARFDSLGDDCDCGGLLELQKVRAEFKGSSEGSVRVVAPPF